MRRPLPKRKHPTFSQWYRLRFGKDIPIRDMEEWEQRLTAAFPGNRNEQGVKAAYNLAASNWHKVLNLATYKASADYTLKNLRFRGDEKVLSLGSGLGVAESFISKHCLPKGQLVGIDISHNMNLEAKKNKGKTGADNLRLVTASARAIPLSSHSQNTVLFLAADVSTLQPFEKTVQEVRRIIVNSPRSRFVMTGNCSDMYYQPGTEGFLTTTKIRWLKKTFLENGWKLADFKPVPRESGGFIFYLVARPV